MARSPEKTPQLESKGYIRRRTPPSVAGACSYGFETHAKRALCATGVLFARMGSGLLSGLIVQGEAFLPKRLKGRPDVVSFNAFWRNGRVVEGTCLENKQGESPRGFKSYFLRQILAPRLVCPRRGFLLSRPSFLSIYRCMQQMQMHSVGACATARRACRFLPWRERGAEEPARAPSWRGRGEGIEGSALRDKGRIEGSARDVPSLSV